MLNDWTQTLLFLLGLCSGVIFILHRTRRYLHYFQQEDYTPHRFFRWLTGNKSFDTRGWTTALAVLAGALLVEGITGRWFYFFGALALHAWVRFEGDPRKTGRKPLVRTPRAKRIERTALLFNLVLLAAIMALLHYGLQLNVLASLWVAQLMCHPVCPLLLTLAVRVLQPHEQRLQRQLKDEAVERLRAVAPIVIGVTGSYGKTSTKSILAGLLTQALEPAFAPPKSINTTMGITREIRVTLSALHRYAVFEMGAYTKGSIAGLCEFVRPTAGIVTTVGVMHLERFGTHENVYQAKSELARSLPDDGILVCNGDDAGARRIAAEFPKKTTLLYGFEDTGDLDCLASDLLMNDKGIAFQLHWKGAVYPVQTCMFGKNAVSNMLGAFTMACALGAEPFYTAAVLANIEPVDNRLSLTKSKKMSFLNDAYNSNPKGFMDALDVLEQYPAKDKILVTPGMIELGPCQEEENRNVAQRAARICSRILLVESVNRATWARALLEGGMPESAVVVHESMPAALKALEEYASREAPPIVLLENDLSDIHEAPKRF
ncbi:MAG: UDP-N-acetylmuramoyl-tripeptide--D-alanyl-D-alanine ligase [Candidatus Hydrogenedentes bacterium]|nr:UDP-N-acetylmuramoyl-tripeptide--D-alanyl-D-alanine ligase [Candidatus Hydrogenedentota bacterium]